MKYDFENLYKDATLLDRDFLKNEFGFDVGVAEDNILYKNYYNDILNYIYEHDVRRLNRQQIESSLNTDEKKYLFLMAQAHQLKYDMTNGRNAMIRGEDGELDIDRDTIRNLQRAGFLKQIMTEGDYCGCGCLGI